MVSNRTKRRFRLMLQAIMKKGKWAMERNDKNQEHTAHVLYRRAYWWMRMTRIYASYARGHDRNINPRSNLLLEEAWYQAHDQEGLYAAQVNLEQEDAWLYDLEDYIHTSTMEGVFPELSTEELDEFEADLRALGFREPHDWSVGFDPNNVPGGVDHMTLIVMMKREQQDQMQQ